MKKRIQHMAAFLCFLLVLCLSIDLATGILMPAKQGHSKSIDDFYKIEQQSLDLIVLGDSSTYRSINPTILWKTQGLTSYVLGAPSARIYTLYYLLEDALKNQQPECVILEVNSMFNDHVYRVGNMRKVIDHMPLSVNKLKMITDPVFGLTNTQKASTILPILMYKTRYNEITKKEIKQYFHNNRNMLKGFVVSKKAKPYRGNKNYMELDKQATLPAASITYLKKIKELCEMHDIPLLLVKVPGAIEWNKNKQALMKDVATRMQLPFVDFNEEMKQKIDWSKDTNDRGVHLNVYGANKVTESLLDYLNRHYEFDCTHSESVNNSYKEAYQAYKKQLHV